MTTTSKITHTKARIKDPGHTSWPTHVRGLPMEDIGELIVDVFSDGERTYVVFPWNSAQNADHTRGWRADSRDQGLWALIKQAFPTSGLLEWRYRGGWFIAEPMLTLDPIVGSGPVSPAAPEGFISLAEHERRLNEFKDRVHLVASKHARENDWCNVVNVALAEMGIHKNVTQRWEVLLRPQLTMYVEAADSEDALNRAFALVGEQVTLKEPDADGTTSFTWEEYDSQMEAD